MLLFHKLKYYSYTSFLYEIKDDDFDMIYHLINLWPNTHTYIHTYICTYTYKILPNMLWKLKQIVILKP